MRTAAILPVKSFAIAKQRLGASVADSTRLGLASAMVGDVLAALHATAAIDQVIVVTREPPVATAARQLGAIVVPDGEEAGQSAAALLGLERAVAEGMERALLVPGDCPALEPAELAALLARTPDAPAEVVIVPDRHGTGTNGLLLSPPHVISPSFGPGSCARHSELAATAGASCRVEQLPSLLLDIDTGEDLAELRERLASGVSERSGGSPEGLPAARTRAALDRLMGTASAA
ncbi:MAG TPA: 2-phospho-L-lactate guanylyltransferase [Solirubrobacteraceae bacterium]|nr:2-phospho-L-lactate guanylyltransferase [Solirubrobacteraceae bacterium]